MKFPILLCLAALPAMSARAADNAEPPATPPASPPPAPNRERVIPPAPPQSSEKERRTLAVAELRDIRFNTAGGISFRHPGTGEVYHWAKREGDPAGSCATAAAVLTELRRAEKVELRLYPQRDGQGKEFHIQGMTLVYDSLR